MAHRNAWMLIILATGSEAPEGIQECSKNYEGVVKKKAKLFLSKKRR